jgi:hypothetical protein
LFSTNKALAGFGSCDPYRRWGLSPRPENIGSPIWAACTDYARPAPLQQAGFLATVGMPAMTARQLRRHKFRRDSRAAKINYYDKAFADSVLFQSLTASIN